MPVTHEQSSIWGHKETYFWGRMQGTVMKEFAIASQGSKGVIALRLVDYNRLLILFALFVCLQCT